MESKIMGRRRPKTYLPQKRKEDVILQIPGATAHLVEGEETIELASGDLAVLRITEQGVPLATAIKIGPSLRWPLTRDEPVIKLDQLHYLFSLPDKGGGSFSNYGVSFAGPDDRLLASLDSILKEYVCLSSSALPKSSSTPNSSSSAEGAYWSGYAPRIEDYNGLLAKAISGGTGVIVKGIFMCSEAYASQVKKGGDLIQSKNMTNSSSSRKIDGAQRMATNKGRGGINKAIQRVRKLSEMTEKITQALLNGVISVSGSVGAPVVESKTGQAFLTSIPGEVLLASLDAVNKVLDAVEFAERKTLAATGGAVAGIVSQRFGESAGEATEDVFATAGHTVGTAWNIFKFRKAITPSSSLPSTILKNAVRKKA